MDNFKNSRNDKFITIQIIHSTNYSLLDNLHYKHHTQLNIRLNYSIV